MADLSIKELLDNVRELGEAKGFVFEPERQFMYLASELGEVSKELLVLTAKGSDEFQKIEARKKLGYEIFDAMWNLAAIASIYDIDVDTAAREKINKNKNRTFKPD